MQIFYLVTNINCLNFTRDLRWVIVIKVFSVKAAVIVTTFESNVQKVEGDLPHVDQDL